MLTMILIIIIIVLLKIVIDMHKKIERLQLKLKIERLSALNSREAMIRMEEGDTQEYVVDPSWFEGCNENGTVAG